MGTWKSISASGLSAFCKVLAKFTHQLTLEAERRSTHKTRMCISLPPLGECGFGSCVNGSCICAEGFSQNAEFFYGATPQDGEISYCDYSERVMVVVASSTLIWTILNVTLNLFVIENVEQVRILSLYCCIKSGRTKQNLAEAISSAHA